MLKNRIVSRDEWLAARLQHLANEKELTRLRDQLSAERRTLPWVKIEKPYLFDTPAGEQTLVQLFDGRSQLIVKHFMLAPGQIDPCVGCSFECDHIDGALLHLEHHDVSFVAVARAPLAEIEAVKRRMGWRFRFVSSYGSDFNYEFHVSFTPEQVARGEAYYNYRVGPVPLEDMSGRSVFYKDANGDVFHTYSAFARGGDIMLGTYNLLDITPMGRNETGPRHNLTDWVRHHDRYDAGGSVDVTGRYVGGAAEPCCAAAEHA